MHAVHRCELLQHLFHGFAGKEFVDEAEERMVLVHEPKDHRFFDKREQVGGNQPDDGRQKFSSKPVDEPLNPDNVMSVRVEFTEADK